MIILIAAIGKNRELGAKNKLLWHLPKDLKRFRALTKDKVVLMGRKTFQSLPQKFKPLPQRINVVITKDKNWQFPSVLVYHSLKEAIEKLEQKYKEIFVIGGASIYQQTINLANKIYLTIVEKDFPQADVFFPDYSNFKIVEEHKDQDSGFKIKFLVLEKKQ